MQDLWIARHANRQDFVDPDWAATADRPHDPGLSPDGVEQAEQLGKRVSTLNVNRIVSSPFLRAVETADRVANALESPVSLEPGLGEWMNSDWFASSPEILPDAELASRFDSVGLGYEACGHPIYPESKRRVLSRIGETARCVVERHAEDSLLLVGHGITVLGVLHGLVGSDVPDTGCPLASFTHLVGQDGEWTIETRNDTSHLDSGPQDADRLA